MFSSASLVMRRLWAKLRTFRIAEGGAIAIIMALSLPVVIGFLGLGVEVGLWFHAKRGLQSSADAAAISGAYERLAGGATSVARSAAVQAAATNGYDGSIGDTMVVNIPPASGEFTGNSNAVEVIASRELQLLFSSLLSNRSGITINAYAVATLADGDDPFCVLSLDHGAPRAVSIGGTANVTLDCGIASNSSAADAVAIFGNADVLAGNVQTNGQISVSGSGGLVTTDGEKENAPRVNDPYAAIPKPADRPCDFNTEVKVQNNSVKTFTPGVYCGGIRINGGTANFLPGVYILKGGDLTINGGVTTGTDVFFYFTQKSGIYSKANIAGNSAVTLSADPDGDRVGSDYSGMLFMQDPNATGTLNKFNGGSTMSLTGVVYTPSQPLEFTGGGNTGGCTVLVGSTVTFNGNSKLQIECENAGVTPPKAPGRVVLAG